MQIKPPHQPKMPIVIRLPPSGDGAAGVPTGPVVCWLDEAAAALPHGLVQPQALSYASGLHAPSRDGGLKRQRPEVQSACPIYVDAPHSAAFVHMLRANDATRASLRCSRAQRLPYFFVQLSAALDNSCLHDAGLYLQQHEWRRMRAMHDEPLTVPVLGAGDMYLITGTKRGAKVFYVIGLDALQQRPDLHELMLDVTMFDYTGTQDMPDEEAIAKACSAMGFAAGWFGPNGADLARGLTGQLDQSAAEYGFSFAMAHAVEFGSLSMVLFCLEHGGCPIMGTRRGYENSDPTPLERAVRHEKAEMVTAMLGRITEADKHTWLPRMFSEERGWPQMPHTICEERTHADAHDERSA